jgi:hypothetical protein
MSFTWLLKKLQTMLFQLEYEQYVAMCNHIVRNEEYLEILKGKRENYVIVMEPLHPGDVTG